MEALEDLITAAQDGFLAELKSDRGRAGLNSILEEIAKLERVQALGVPGDLFADCSEKLIAGWRARAATAYPSDLRAMPRPVRLTLLAVLCWARTAEITDGLVDLLLEVVHKIRTRAEDRVERELVKDLKRVRGKLGCCSRSPRPRSSTRTTPSARRCSRSCQRRRCASWSRRRPTSSCSSDACAR